MTDIRIGTSGYDYLDWAGTFYPSELPRKQFLSYYSQQFDTLELNFTYYKMPTRKQLGLMASTTGKHMDFSIKANESMTHKVDYNIWESTVREFLTAIEPLRQDDRLSAVLFQFPYSFSYTIDNRRYLARLLSAMDNTPSVVEFRNAQWINQRVFNALKERNSGYCITDMPHLRGLPPSVDMVTAPVSYIRFHGRNEKNWWGSDAARRFDYLYSETELHSWVSRIRTLLTQSDKLRVFFNNHRKGQAAANAMMLKYLIMKSVISGEIGDEK
ncbi:MAG: DUF72 domain-containing protein [Deltaproteobacteria bacterium]|nr:DUF72 domain-containing protein [Deltaproteobacteria bacterium]